RRPTATPRAPPARRWRPGAGRSASCARRRPTWSRSSFVWWATESDRRHDGPRPRRQGAPALLHLVPLLRARERVPRALGVLLLHQPELLRGDGRHAAPARALAVPVPRHAAAAPRPAAAPHHAALRRGAEAGHARAPVDLPGAGRRDHRREVHRLPRGGHLERGGDERGDPAPPAALLALRPLLHFRARRGGHRQRELPRPLHGGVSLLHALRARRAPLARGPLMALTRAARSWSQLVLQI